MNNSLEIKNLNVKVGNFHLKEINFSVQEGTIMGLVGKNGAGKTTLIKTIMDMIQRQSGEILYFDLPMLNNEESIKNRIGIVFDSLIYPLSINSKFIKKNVLPFYKNFDPQRFDDLMIRFELDPKKRFSSYSKGMQMKIGLVMALSHNPDLIILDEPTAGLDPIARNEVVSVLQEIMQDEKKSVLFSTHITSDLDKIGDYITLIDDGKIIFSESKEDLLSQYTIVQIDKSIMNEELYSKLSGARETAFGFEGLTNDKELIEMSGVKISRPTIEDIIVFRGGL